MENGPAKKQNLCQILQAGRELRELQSILSLMQGNNCCLMVTSGGSVGGK
jgi:hypothetical protein